ncbi:MAG: hypothetical protein RLZZ241_1454 [Bacteroidota bacterium]|jgi:hypothetical protein
MKVHPDYLKSMNKRLFISALVLLIVAGCKPEGSLFESPSGNSTGITFANVVQETDALNILDYLYFYNGGGVAIGDINSDGLPDIFFSGNQVKNKLYLNKGSLEFEDISEAAGISGNSSWNTGAVMADVNGDGLLDIYVSAVVGINGFSGHNELFINNGDTTFTEQAAAYGLDFDSYSSNAAFFDFDLDGDLDLFLLNHAVHTQDSYGKAALRYAREYETGDKLMRNDNGHFTEVSEHAGIYGGINGYGLGLAISDFNLDGYPDLYIGNDFHEDDYYYINNTDGTFTDRLRDYFGHTSRFSMGSDVADINNDGRPDLISLDMLPGDEIPLKTSEGDDNFQTQRMRIEDYGYYYQFTRNMLFINQPEGAFLETALMSGVAATDWSWSALFGDYNLDGNQDLFISNGIPKRPNDLDFVRFISNEQISSKLDNTRLIDQKALNMMPSGSVHNYIFEGNSNGRFDDRSGDWITQDTLVSGATGWADLDLDGDLDLVVNNLNKEASLMINKTNDSGDYLKIYFRYHPGNNFGIGSKAYAYSGKTVRYRELFPVRGFQSSSEPMLHFGFPKGTQIDSLLVVWPDQTSQVIPRPKTNQTLIVAPENNKPFSYKQLQNQARPWFHELSDTLKFQAVHIEDKYTDFIREKLLPYSMADRGPAAAVADFNGDGTDDIFIGGSKRVAAQYLSQKQGSYSAEVDYFAGLDSIAENVVALAADFDGDGLTDLVLGNGGSDYYGESQPLQNMYYRQTNAGFKGSPLPGKHANTSSMAAADFDGDGDLDLFIGNQTYTGNFGLAPNSYLLENDGGTWVVSDKLNGEALGMVTDAVWTDFNADGAIDLIVVGEWMQPVFFENQNGKMVQSSMELPKGLWEAIAPFDLDGDGDLDYLLGNWGTNSKFTASKNAPMRLYLSDFDTNGNTDPILATQRKEVYYPLANLDELGGQLPYLRKVFPNYHSFAGKSIEEIFDASQLQNAKILEVDELRTGYLKNNNGSFEFMAFSDLMQTAPILEFLTADFNGDGKTEVLAGGNYFGVKPFMGRLDAFPGAIIQNEKHMVLTNRLGLNFSGKSVRKLSLIRLGNRHLLLAVYNNRAAEIYELIYPKHLNP